MKRGNKHVCSRHCHRRRHDTTLPHLINWAKDQTFFGGGVLSKWVTCYPWEMSRCVSVCAFVCKTMGEGSYCFIETTQVCLSKYRAWLSVLPTVKALWATCMTGIREAKSSQITATWCRSLSRNTFVTWQNALISLKYNKQHRLIK